MSENVFDIHENLIDVRGIIERYVDLENELADMIDAVSSAYAERKANPEDEGLVEAHHEVMNAERDWRANDGKELRDLRDTLDDLKGNGGDEQWRGDWYPVTLIRDSYFERYIDEMLEDFGELPKDLPSYLTIKVDYNALQMDYTSTEIDGVTYYYR